MKGQGVAAVALVAALFSAAAGVSGQTPRLLRGHLVDADSYAPVVGAFVALVDEARGVLTDGTGYFALPAPVQDEYHMRFKQLGYRELTMSVTAEAAAGQFLFQLVPNPVEIEGLKVLVERFDDRRRGPFGAVDLFEQADLLRVSDGAASDMIRRVVPFAQPCRDDDEELCFNNKGENETLVVCVDGRQVVEGMVELEHLDPRGLYMVEVFRRGGQVRIYTRGYVERLLASGAELPPLSFGCGIMSGGPGS